MSKKYTKDQLVCIAAMNKATLRDECKAAAIKGYGKMTVAEMRAAVRQYMEREMAAVEPVVTAEPVPAVEPTAAPAAVELVNDAKAPAPKMQCEMRNGVKRPGANTVCGAVWAALDAMLAAGTTPASKDARDLATAKDWNLNNATIELGRWRKFHGLTRPVKVAAKTVAKAAPPATRTDGSVDQYVA